jgi:hypothetical protein
VVEAHPLDHGPTREVDHLQAAARHRALGGEPVIASEAENTFVGSVGAGWNLTGNSVTHTHS